MKHVMSRVSFLSRLGSLGIALLLTGCMIALGKPGGHHKKNAPQGEQKMATMAPASAPTPVYYDIRSFGAALSATARRPPPNRSTKPSTPRQPRAAVPSFSPPASFSAARSA
jgi:hypothetical protein